MCHEEVSSRFTACRAPFVASNKNVQSTPSPRQVIVMAYAEVQRSLEENETTRKYPGGSFDPLRFASSGDIDTLKVNPHALMYIRR